MSLDSQCIRVIDTHTGGEPTRVVIDSPLEFTGLTMAERRSCFARQYDDYRRAVVCEPRGNDVIVGAWLTPPVEAGSQAGVIFFNNVGYLGMCGHGTIGVAVALAHLGRLPAGTNRLDTPVGTVQFEYLGNGKVRVGNVPSYRYRQRVAVQLSNGRHVHGDIAWGGNWFFICDDHGLTVDMAHLQELEALSREIRWQLERQRITGAQGGVIDHVELLGSPSDPLKADSRNFVLCPGGAYDRSPCGTGTSAKVACLAADGRLAPGACYRQQSIVGSIFEASYQIIASGVAEDPRRMLVAPTLVGSAYVNARADLLFDPEDPFRMGISL
jgi:4-hydroxyproline epimerase